MQPVAVELSFDLAAERRVAAIWAKLEREYMKCGVSELGLRPHVSLAVFQQAEPPQLEQATAKLAANLRSFALNFVRVDAFRSSEGVVFLEPVASPELVEAHSALMSLLGAGKSSVHPYYREGAWVPHCTVAVGVPAGAIDRVTVACRASSALGPVTVCRVSVVQYRPTIELYCSELTGDARPTESA